MPIRGLKIFNVQAESAREVSKVITRNHGDLLSYSLMNLRRILAITSISIFAAAALVAPTWAAGNPHCPPVSTETKSGISISRYPLLYLDPSR